MNLVMKSIGVRGFLFVVLSVLTAIPVLWLGSVQASRYEQQARSRYDQLLTAAARSISWQLSQLLENRQRDLELLATNVELLGDLRGPRAEELVRRHCDAKRYYAGCYLGDLAGNALVQTPPQDNGDTRRTFNYGDRDYFQSLLHNRRTAISRVQMGRRLGVPNVQIAAPIFDSGHTLTGYAEGSISLEPLFDLVLRGSRDISEGRILILDATSRVVANSSPSNRLVLQDLSSLQLLQHPDGCPPLRTARDDRGVLVRGAVMDVGEPLGGWVVAVLLPISSVERYATEGFRQTWMAASLAWLAALALSGLIANQFGKRLSDLAATVRAVGRGEFTRRAAPIRHWEPKEIGDLVEQVDVMAQQLQQYTGDLRGLVRARTQELASVNERLTILVNALERAGDGIEITGPDTKYLYVNPALEAISGYSSNELLGQIPHLLHGYAADEEAYQAIWRTCRDGHVYNGISVARRKDGTSFEQELTVWPIRDESGAITHFVGLRRDVTERRKTEHALRVSERMSSVGTLAAGVAHEINNPLTYVVLSLRQIQLQLERRKSGLPKDHVEQISSALDYALEGAERVEAIVKDLRMFSRADDQTLNTLDPCEILDSTLRMVSTNIRHRAQLIRDYQAVPNVLGNQSRLSQVFMNLLMNAVQSLESGDTGHDEVRVHTSTDKHGNAVIEITDTGVGIRPEHVHRIFDPFYSTKPVGVGTGLGLSMCHKIVKSMSGEIQVVSTPGKGSTFRIVLPSAEESSGCVPLSRPHSVPVQLAPRCRVLIVDDDPSVAESLRLTLEHHDAQISTSGTDALNQLAKSRFDVVICDIMMPGMTGLELLECLVQQQPDYRHRFLFITGGVLSEAIRVSLDATRVPRLEKPLTPNQLEAAISKVLGESQATRTAASG